MIIEKMTTNDIKAVMYIETKVLSTGRTAEAWRSTLLLNDAVQFFVGKKRNRIIGYYEAYFGVGVTDIYFLAVDPNWQRRGYGNELLTHLLKIAADNQCVELFLEVRKSNFRAQSLYQKKGFIIIGLRKNYYCLPNEDALIMCKKLENKNVFE